MTHLIDKDALVAGITKIYDRNRSNGYIDVCDEIDGILSFIDTLEVKEMDLEKEVENWVKIGPHTSYPWCTIPDAIRITAKHFFELGLKAAQKGEKV